MGKAFIIAAGRFSCINAHDDALGTVFIRGFPDKVGIVIGSAVDGDFIRTRPEQVLDVFQIADSTADG
jgi:hypothetical protein